MRAFGQGGEFATEPERRLVQRTAGIKLCGAFRRPLIQAAQRKVVEIELEVEPVVKVVYVDIAKRHVLDTRSPGVPGRLALFGVAAVDRQLNTPDQQAVLLTLVDDNVETLEVHRLHLDLFAQQWQPGQLGARGFE